MYLTSKQLTTISIYVIRLTWFARCRTEIIWGEGPEDLAWCRALALLQLHERSFASLKENEETLTADGWPLKGHQTGDPNPALGQSVKGSHNNGDLASVGDQGNTGEAGASVNGSPLVDSPPPKERHRFRLRRHVGGYRELSSLPHGFFTTPLLHVVEPVSSTTSHIKN